MVLVENEIKCGFLDFYVYVDCKGTGVFTFAFGEKRVDAKLFTIFEDENHLEEGDPNYKEYNTVLFKTLDGTLLKINYLNLPDEVYHDGKLIFKKIDGKLTEMIETEILGVIKGFRNYIKDQFE